MVFGIMGLGLIFANGIWKTVRIGQYKSVLCTLYAELSCNDYRMPVSGWG